MPRFAFEDTKPIITDEQLLADIRRVAVALCCPRLLFIAAGTVSAARKLLDHCDQEALRNVEFSHCSGGARPDE